MVNESDDNDPNRRELNYSKAYRKKYEERFGGKDKLNQKVNGVREKDKLSGNQRVNGLGEQVNVQSNINRSKDNLNQKVNSKINVQSNLNRRDNDGKRWGNDKDKLSGNQKVNGLGDYFKSSSTSFKSKQ